MWGSPREDYSDLFLPQPYIYSCATTTEPSYRFGPIVSSPEATCYYLQYARLGAIASASLPFRRNKRLASTDSLGLKTGYAVPDAPADISLQNTGAVLIGFEQPHACEAPGNGLVKGCPRLKPLDGKARIVILCSREREG